MASGRNPDSRGAPELGGVVGDPPVQDRATSTDGGGGNGLGRHEARSDAGRGGYGGGGDGSTGGGKGGGGSSGDGSGGNRKNGGKDGGAAGRKSVGGGRRGGRGPANDNPTRTPTRLELFPGLRLAKAWAFALAKDFKDWKDRKLPWSGVDKGALIYGAPGTGKSTFAELVAEHIGIPANWTSYSDWQTSGDRHLGDVLARIREVFDQAIKSAPCIVVIEEIEAVSSRSRDAGRNREWYSAVINTLLEQFDRLKKAEGVIVIGITNHPDHLDAAIARAGRLDRKIEIGLPDASELEEIIRFHLRGDLEGLSLRPIALACHGVTGADVEQIVRDGRRSARHEDRAMLEADLFAAIRQGRPERPGEYTRRVGVHELGHAVLAIVLGHASEGTVSIVERGERLGLTSMRMCCRSLTRRALEEQIMVQMGGRAAEHVVFGDVSTGSGGSEDSDLVKATGIGIDMLLAYGMSNRGLLEAYPPDERKAMLLALPEVRRELGEILKDAEERAREIIIRHRAGLEQALGELLAAKGLDFVAIRRALGMQDMPPTPAND